MGAGWYRDAYYPAELLVDRRSVDSLAEELVAEVTDGVGDTGIRPGILGEIGTDKPWVTPAEERVHRAVGPGVAAGPASRSRPTPSCPTSGPRSSRSSRRRASTPGGS